MMRRRSIHLVAGLTTFVAPLAAWAQGPTGSVTTDPVQQAPALGMSVIVALAVAMAGVGVYRLRRTVAGRIVGFVLIAAATVLVGLAYAGGLPLTIKDADCTKQTTSTFNPLDANTLMSGCPNLIRIVDIQVSCDGDMSSLNSAANVGTLPDCGVGQTLANGAGCILPVCS